MPPYSIPLSTLPLPISAVSPLAELEDVHSYRKVRALDVDEHADNLGEWDQSYDQLSAGPFQGTLCEVWIGDMQIFREITTQSVLEQGYAWKGARLFGIPMAMTGSGSFCDRSINDHGILSVGPGSEFSLRSPKEFDVIGVAIKEENYQRVVASLEDAGSRRMSSTDGATVIRCESGLRELRVFLDALFDVLDDHAAILSHPTAQKTIHSALLGHICDSVQTASDMPAPHLTYQARKAVVDRARHHVLSKPYEPVTIAELCEVLHVSRRTIQYCFQEVLNTNPIQYLRTMRLNCVRRELRDRNPAVTQIQDIAARWGFWHLSHFARDYRIMFGELPSDTLHKE